MLLDVRSFRSAEPGALPCARGWTGVPRCLETAAMPFPRSPPGGRGCEFDHALLRRVLMKRFTSSLALAAFVMALTAPLALAQGSSSTDATKPAAPAAAPAMAAPAAKKAHAMHHMKGAGAAKMAAKKDMVDINSATKEDLTKVPGITD